MAISQEMKQAVKPQVDRLKQLGTGLRVDRVLGDRVLVRTVVPVTELDRIEQEGKLVIPKYLKKEYTPLPSTGVVILLGDGLRQRLAGGDLEWMQYETLREGSMVLFSKFAGVEFVVEEEDFKILHVNEILCTLVDISTVPSVVAVKGEV